MPALTLEEAFGKRGNLIFKQNKKHLEGVKKSKKMGPNWELNPGSSEY